MLKRSCCRRVVSAVALLLLASAASPALGAKRAKGLPPSDYGFDFVTVGAPGNRAMDPSEFPKPASVNLPADFGVVNHRYRIATTQVTATDWIEFVNAYDPYWTANGGSRFDSGFTSSFIRPVTANPNFPPNYSIFHGFEQSAIEVTWNVAARYVNWLHNGKVNEEWAFETGAYDTSTFGVRPPGASGWTDQATRSPDALFWIPSLNEWTKAAHFDPDRDGEGQEGYWLRQGSRHDPLVSGRPEDGGETSAGPEGWFPNGFNPRTIPVGSYPDIQSPWGLLDTSGAAREWTETVGVEFADGTNNRSRSIFGTSAGEGFHWERDRIDWYHRNGIASLERAGIRLASVIPMPSTAVACAMMGAVFMQRRSRLCSQRIASRSRS